LVLPAVLIGGCSSGTSGSTTTTATPSTTQVPLSRTAVRILQGYLAKVGCYPGKIDGVTGPVTTRAVRAFQSASGLPVDGDYGAQTRTRLLAAVNGGTRVCPATSTSTTAATAETTTTTARGTVPPAATAAITAYEAANGPTPGTWVIAGSHQSSLNPSYVFFRIGPAPGHQNSVQGGYGFVLDTGGSWNVIGFGSSEVGCPPGGPKDPVIPGDVLAEFGVSCPST
jgi:peptidoglycan hydrolase-like protein with peptidoglycan-binding domain